MVSAPSLLRRIGLPATPGLVPISAASYEGLGRTMLHAHTDVGQLDDRWWPKPDRFRLNAEVDL
jgi:hypothetical protein